MQTKIIGLIVCLLCSTPWLLLALNKSSDEPIGFLKMDHSLKHIIGHLDLYNKEMSFMYIIYGTIYFPLALILCVYPFVGYFLLGLHLSVGLYFVNKRQKALVSKYGK